jgi:hypothetical protein
MNTQRESDPTKLERKIQEMSLRLAANAYLHTAIKSYVELAGEVSIWNPDRFGLSANVVCSLNRAIEHLLKLRLCKTDWLLLFPLPKKVEEYCLIKEIPMQGNQSPGDRKRERELLSHSISFKEALSRVILTSNVKFDFSCFGEIYALRNSLEHHWDRNEEFLKKVVGNMSGKIIPCLKEFITNILKEDEKYYFFDSNLLEEVDRLDRAFLLGHSLELQHRFEEHKELFARNPELCREKWTCPDKYERLLEEEIKVDCPICGEKFLALWDWEPEYEVEGGEGYVSNAFPDVKCLYCVNCHFYVEGRDIETYCPDGIEIEFERDWDEY